MASRLFADAVNKSAEFCPHIRVTLNTLFSTLIDGFQAHGCSDYPRGADFAG